MVSIDWPAVMGEEEKSLWGRAVETVSETFKGAAEGLQHSTQLVAGHAVAAKEDAREGVHQMTKEPSKNDSSYFDRGKEQVQATAEEAQEKLGSPPPPIRERHWESSDRGTGPHPDDPRYYKREPMERLREPHMQLEPSPSLGERIKATFTEPAAPGHRPERTDPDLADPYSPKHG